MCFGDAKATVQAILADLPAVQQVEVRSDERCGQLAYIRLAAADAALEQLIGERLAGFAVGYRLEYAHRECQVNDSSSLA